MSNNTDHEVVYVKGYAAGWSAAIDQVFEDLTEMLNYDIVCWLSYDQLKNLKKKYKDTQ